MYSQSYGLSRPSSNANPTVNLTNMADIKADSVEPPNSSDSGIELSPPDVSPNQVETELLQNGSVAESEELKETENETAEEKSILEFAVGTSKFEDVYLRAADIINYIKDNYKSESSVIVGSMLETIQHQFALGTSISYFFTQKLHKHKFIDVLMELWDYFWSQNCFSLDTPLAGEWRNNMLFTSIILANLTDTNTECANKMVSSGFFVKLLSVFGEGQIVAANCTNDSVKISIGESILVTLYNCIRWRLYEAKPIFRANEGMVKMSLLKEQIGDAEEFQPWLVNALLCMAYTLEENEESLLDEDTKMAMTEFLCEHASEAVKGPDRRFGGMALSEYIEAINVLLASDTRKLQLCAEPNLFDCITTAVRTNDDETELIALVRCLYLLTFIDEGKKRLTDNEELMKAIEKLKEHNHRDVKRNAEGTLWNVSGQRPPQLELSPILTESIVKSQQHVMISYDWNHQKIAAAINLQLKSLGYFTWMDIDRMSGSTLEAMASAVEQSAVIVVCFSERYKNSPNCRKEAEYASSLQKPIIPVKTDANYKADGWLGIMLGTTLYLECSSVEMVISMMPKLIKELGNRGMLGQSTLLLQPDSTQQPSKSLTDEISVMSSEELKLQFNRVGWKWLVEDLTGAELSFLYQLQQQSIDEFHRTLREDLALKDWRIRLKFADCVKQINLLVSSS